MSKEKWEQLLTPETFRPRSASIPADGRNPFEKDYGRLISSAPIRRLQDKTQVFPLEQSDYIRTRLTHSLEVSYIGSSIGTSVEQFLREHGYLDSSLNGHISSLLRVAGLVHDIGNPPFGHFGELAIQHFFKKLNGECHIFNGQEQNDYENFDGNVQTFRILRKLYWFKDEHSFNLTYPVLASIVKYPSNSLDGNKGKDSQEIRLKKYGYYKSEEEDYKKINECLGLNNKRHPVSYLMEAADDIAYCAADVEDGVKLGVLDYETITQIFDQNLQNHNKELLNKFKQFYDQTDKKLDRLTVAIQQIRVEAQAKMIEQVLESFKEHYTDIMAGDLPKELVDISAAADIRKSFKELGTLVYDDKRIIQIELAGWEAVNGLLDIFVNCMLDSDSQNSNRLYKNISRSYRYIHEFTHKRSASQYDKIQLVVDFISGMTDSYAINLYQKLKGIKL